MADAISYVDKSLGTTVELKPSRNQFLVLMASEEAEAVRPLLDLRTLTAQKGHDASVGILRAKSEGESAVAVQSEIDTLRADPRVAEVVPAVIDGSGTTRFVYPGRVVVNFEGLDPAAIGRRLSRLGSDIVQRFRSPGLVTATVPAGTDTASFIATLNADDAVTLAEPAFYGVDDHDVRFSAFATDGAEAAEAEGVVKPQWNLSRVDAEGAWAHTRGDPETVVFVVDGRPQDDHEALRGKLLLDPAAPAVGMPVSSHATNIASLVAGESATMSGLAPAARVVPVAVDLTAGLYAERADAIREAVAAIRAGTINGCGIRRGVLSCSWGTAGDVSIIRLALAEAVAAGMLVVCSAGNDGGDGIHFPSAYSARPDALGRGLLCVVATNGDDRKPAYSNYTATADIAAPGGDGLPLDERDILCAEQNSGYGYSAGTSIAVPHVAAAAALALSANPALDPAGLKQLLRDTADPIDDRNPDFAGAMGAGRLNARRAVEAALQAVRTAALPDPPGSPQGGPTFNVVIGVAA